MPSEGSGGSRNYSANEKLRRKSAGYKATFKERYPASAMSGLGVKDKGPSMDSAFSNPDSEYALGNALRKKAGQ